MRLWGMGIFGHLSDEQDIVVALPIAGLTAAHLP